MKKEEKRLLLVDDDESLRSVLEFGLREAGYEPVSEGTGAGAVARLGEKDFDVVVTDLRLPDMGGIEVLKAARRRRASARVIVITAYGSVEQAVEAMKLGAFDYLTKPFSRDEFLLVVAKAFEVVGLERENVRLRDEIDRTYARESMIGRSAAMEKVFAVIERVASSTATVLIWGESGTGKELVARAIHHSGERKHGSFVAVNCAAIPRDLLESELFGHVKGAFTGAHRDHEGKFAAADGGTIFLDEVGSLDLGLQAKLLRVLQQREVDPLGGSRPVAVDVRVIAASNAPLAKRVEEGAFREDLFYRLNVIPIEVPPLRERKEDIPLLVRHFTRKYATSPGTRFTDAAVARLARHPWKGNVRELENVVERTIVLCPKDEIGADCLPEEVLNPRDESGPGGFALELPAEGISLMDLEKQAIVCALERNGWNQARAARFLRVPRHILVYRMEKFGIAKPRGPSGAGEN